MKGPKKPAKPKVQSVEKPKPGSVNVDPKPKIETGEIRSESTVSDFQGDHTK